MREGVMPFPVTSISTISRDGIRNIVPWSCIMPVLRPLDLVCAASAKKRDTLQNIRETGEFVINLAGVHMMDKVIPTAWHSPPNVDEFLQAGIEEKPSISIKPPGIAGCYAWMECERVKEYEEDKFVLILGRVLRLEVDDRVLNTDGSTNIEKAMPLMMTGGRKGMHSSTMKDLAQHEPLSAMFPDGKNPLGSLYGK